MCYRPIASATKIDAVAFLSRKHTPSEPQSPTRHHHNEIESANGIDFIVMAYVRGKSLDAPDSTPRDDGLTSCCGSRFRSLMRWRPRTHKASSIAI